MERVTRRGERLPSEADAFDKPADAGADAEPCTAVGQLVERGELHRDQRRMMAVHIDYAEADPQTPGQQRAGRSRRQHTALQRVFRKPQRCETVGLGGLGKVDARPWIKPAVQPQADFRQFLHRVVLWA